MSPEKLASSLDEATAKKNKNIHMYIRLKLLLIEYPQAHFQFFRIKQKLGMGLGVRINKPGLTVHAIIPTKDTKHADTKYLYYIVRSIHYN